MQLWKGKIYNLWTKYSNNRKHLVDYNTYNIKFRYNNVGIALLFNELLHSNLNYVLHCSEVGKTNPKVYINFMKYSEKFIEFNKNFLGFKYKNSVKNYFLKAFLDKKGTLDTFWRIINNNVKNGNYFI